ncbi:lysophospholipid acyltransferase family protein [Chitinimonas koreensis]|uniref:lysophospholipid acyltransferase family protein n=1 Tax=Chitinimonas koreensis TaxID=356302 RepID=UPI00048FC5BC|nr:lysophospholipid acyltransferase family protein [Chitinimonas koreensis]QNM97196.1 1-acyl-sn-glycerol-3-phosphate acyltransferase [Chitinimonas koreensis]
MKKTALPIRAWRIGRLLLHLVLGVLEIALLFKFRDAAGRAAAISRWARRLCRILAVEVVVNGSRPAFLPANTVLVANHVSWLDIFVMNTVSVSRFVAKAEVRNWPIVGWLCVRTGTLFVTRERRHDTARVNRSIADALAEGSCIAVFPEGSTTDGFSLAGFNASLLQPAVDAGAEIVPVALRYYDRTRMRSKAAAYVGEMSLLDSLLQLLVEPRLEAELHFFEPIPASGLHRRDLARTAEALIGEKIRSDLPNSSQSVAAAATEPGTVSHRPG